MRLHTGALLQVKSFDVFCHIQGLPCAVPVSCRRHKSVIVLTTHSMEEADLLCDDIHIMAEGRLAASGSPLSLKARYGVGYTFTVVLQQPQHSKQAQQAKPQQPAPGLHGAMHRMSARLQHGVGGGSSSSMASSASTSSLVQQGRAAQAHAAADGLMQLVQQHIPSAQLLSAAGSEVSIRLPKEEAAAFPAALRALDAATEQLGVSSYGLSVTTLEEVFLAIADQAVAVSNGSSSYTQSRQQQHSMPQHQRDDSLHAHDTSKANDHRGSKHTSNSRMANTAPGVNGDLSAAEQGLPPSNNSSAKVLTGVALYWQQLKALFVKRALCAR